MDSQFAQELMIVWQSLQESALAGSRHLSDVFHHLHEREVLHCVSTDTFGEGDDARLIGGIGSDRARTMSTAIIG